MNKITKAGVLLAGALLASQAAQAQFTANDVYLGFQNSTATSDYIVNLGSLSGLIDTGTPVNLSGDFSMSDFSSVYGTSGTTLVAAVGADNNVNDAFGTVTRTSNIGVYTEPGSTAPLGLNYGEDATVYTDIGGIKVPGTAGTGNMDSTKSWSSKVSPTQVSGDFYSGADFNPNSAITTSSVLYEDLYVTTDTSGGGRSDTAQPFAYEGYFTLDFTGSSPDVTFTPVPEPSNYLICCLGGILMLALRLRPGRRNV